MAVMTAWHLVILCSNSKLCLICMLKAEAIAPALAPSLGIIVMNIS